MPKQDALVTISGRVIRGDGYGKVLGFPTANLDRRHFMRLNNQPRLGIYAGRASVGVKIYAAAIVIGPKDKKGLPKIEAHLLDFRGNLYGKKLSIQLIQYLRPFKPYTTEKNLIQQIMLDVKKVRAIIKQKTK